VKLSVKHADGSTLELQVNHTMNEGQITWFRSGSALNKMSADMKAAKK